MYIVLILIVFGLLTGVVASSKGRSFIGWFVYGCFLGIFALIHASLIGNRGLKCPKCYSYIDRRATVCPFCKHKRTPEEIKSANKARQKGFDTKLIVAIVIISILFLIGIITNAINSSTQQSLDHMNQETMQNNGYYFDVPSLIGRNLDDLTMILGTPTGKDPTDLQIQTGAKEWNKTFLNNDKELFVTYRISDKKIIDFFIGTDDPSGKTKDTSTLLKIAHAKENDPKYSVEYVKALNDPSSYTGIKIIPN